MPAFDLGRDVPAKLQECSATSKPPPVTAKRSSPTRFQNCGLVCTAQARQLITPTPPLKCSGPPSPTTTNGANKSDALCCLVPLLITAILMSPAEIGPGPVVRDRRGGHRNRDAEGLVRIEPQPLMVVAHRECDLRIDVGCDQLRGPAIVTDRDETGGAVVRQQARITVSLQPFFSASRALCGMCAGPNRSLK